MSRRIFSRIFSPDFFSSFLWEKVPRKILQENPRENPPKFIQQKSSNTFLQIAQGKKSPRQCLCGGFPLPIPPPKRIRRFDAMPPTSPGPTFWPVCTGDVGSVAAFGAHYNSFHAIRDNRLVTKPPFQCSRCDLVFQSKFVIRALFVRPFFLFLPPPHRPPPS